MTTSTEIETILYKDKQFKGCFPHDKLPKVKCSDLPLSLIINTDDSNKGGDHWVGIVMTKKNCYYFDSFGVPVLSVHVLKFLKKFYKYVVYSSKQVQSIFSDKCGYFTAGFVCLVKSVNSYNKFLNLFSNDFAVNDSVCINLFKK